MNTFTPPGEDLESGIAVIVLLIVISVIIFLFFGKKSGGGGGGGGGGTEGGGVAGGGGGDVLSSLVSVVEDPLTVGIALDSNYVYFSDFKYKTIKRIGHEGGNIDLIASGLIGPKGIALDATNVYFIDGNTIKKVAKTGGSVTVVVQIAGTDSDFPDGQGIALDATNVYFIHQNSVKKVAKTGGGAVTVVVQTSELYDATIDGPPPVLRGLAVKSSSSNIDFYITDAVNHKVIKVTRNTSTSTNQVTTIVHLLILKPEGVVIDSSGNNLYITTSTDIGSIHKVSLTDGTLSTIILADSYITNLRGLAINSSNYLYFGAEKEPYNGIMRVTANNNDVIINIYSYLIYLGLLDPKGIAIDSSGNLYISDTGNNRIMKLSLSSNNGLAEIDSAASIGIISPLGLAIDSSGDLYIADIGNSRIKKVTSSAPDITLASDLIGPKRIALDATNVYFIDGNTIKKVAKTGGSVIEIVPASAGMNSPSGLAIDSSGNLYISDTGNNRIVKVSTIDNNLTVIVPASSGINSPKAITIDSSNYVYFINGSNNVIYKFSLLSPSIFSQIIPANSGLLEPSDIVVDSSSNNLYIADTDNNRIVKLELKT